MDNKKVLNYIAGLESKLDLLESELCSLDQMLLDSGFPEGVKTLKEILDEISTENKMENPFPFDF